MRLIHLPGHTAWAAAMAVAALCIALVFVSCEDAEQPTLADVMTIFSGDGQFSKIGTQLAVPLTVNLRLADGTPAQGFGVDFSILSGDGTLSNSTDTSDDAGQAQTRLTLGPTPGIIRVRASSGELFVDFRAEASNFFCLEEDPDPGATPDFGNITGLDLFLVTRHSRLHTKDGVPIGGVIRIKPDFLAAGGPKVTTTSIVAFAEDFGIQATPKDCAFSRSEDLFV
ncbi:MAG: Ig-like domain-containing protein, partial [Candidatus Krumholzibacteriota bacterium]|nr:Ig-like domain-containing protein [Candidatus Krumholzibacteriota bacterium]